MPSLLTLLCPCCCGEADDAAAETDRSRLITDDDLQSQTSGYASHPNESATEGTNHKVAHMSAAEEEQVCVIWQ